MANRGGLSNILVALRLPKLHPSLDVGLGRGQALDYCPYLLLFPSSLASTKNGVRSMALVWLLYGSCTPYCTLYGSCKLCPTTTSA